MRVAHVGEKGIALTLTRDDLRELCRTGEVLMDRTEDDYGRTDRVALYVRLDRRGRTGGAGIERELEALAADRSSPFRDLTRVDL